MKMSYENAKKGIGQIFTAEILQLLSAIFAIIGTIITITGIAAIIGGAATGTDVAMGGGLAGSIVGIIMTVIGAIFALIGFILYIVGVGTAGKDEENFKKAFMFLILGLICSIIGAFTGAVPVLAGILKIASAVFSLASAIFVINGIIVLAGKVGNAKVEKKGQTTLKLVIVILVLSIVAHVIAMITALVFGSANDITAAMVNGATATIFISSIMELVATVLSIIQYFVYLSLLANAKNMFQ